MTVPPVAPPLRSWAFTRQEWVNAAFLHWSVDPELVAPYLPRGTRPDVFDGRTFVGLIPFELTNLRPGNLPSLPWGDFLETNVRLYSIDDEGNHGVVFRSLDAARLDFVLAARGWLRVPYEWSHLRASVDGDEHTYFTRRRGRRRHVRSTVTVRVGERIEPTPLDVFLTARWGAHSRVLGRTLWIPNTHEPWRLHAAEVSGGLSADGDGLVAAAGFPALGAPDVPVRWSPGVHAAFGFPRVVAK